MRKFYDYTQDEAFKETCVHIKKVLEALTKNKIAVVGDTQVVGLECKECNKFFGF